MPPFRRGVPMPKLCAFLVGVLLAGCPGGPNLSPNVTLTSDLVYGQGYVEDPSSASGFSLRDLRFDFLGTLTGAFDDLHEVIDDAILEAQDDVEISKTDVGVDDHHPLAREREPRGKIGRGRRLSDAALPGRNNDALGHAVSSYFPRTRL